MQRTVFYISDGTAITAETLGHALLTQFRDIEFRQVRLPFVDSEQKVVSAAADINAAAEKDGRTPIVFNTIVDARLSEILEGSNGEFIDLLGTFMQPLADILGSEPKPRVGHAHGVGDQLVYESRIEATNYALNHDDGISISFDHADLILVGVSRSGKTPTCLYMALHYGVKAANYPLTGAELDAPQLPKFLRAHKKKIFGLTIEPERLAAIRETRKPGSRYASVKRCRYEVAAVESLLRQEGIPIQTTTHSSIEEIAGRVMQHMGLQRELF
jgi:regulator of PEP synthase PpsR (kinase-PPPase family)